MKKIKITKKLMFLTMNLCFANVSAGAEEVLLTEESNFAQESNSAFGEYDEVSDSYENDEESSVESEKNSAKEYVEMLSDGMLEESEQLLSLQEGELIVLRQVRQLTDESPALLNKCPVAYAINVETGQSYGVMVYHYNGVNHSYILNEETEVTDELQTDFKEFIRENYENGRISRERSEADFVTITADAFYSDTYIEAGGVENTGTWGIKTLFEIEPKYATAGVADRYTIHGIHRVYPYAWTKYVTTYYSHGINIFNEGDTVISAAPADAEISLNKNQTYSFSVSIPPGVSVDISWTGNTGTQMRARRRNHQHDIVFTNNKGVFGNEDNGSFQYETYTNMWADREKPFTFFYNEVIGNAVYGNGQDQHMYGNQWYIVTPNFNHSSSGNAGTKYEWEGRDYSCVFNPAYYLNSYPDLQNAFGDDYTAAFQHFISNGMAEGRQAITSFNVYAYKERYSDLRAAFGDDLVQYYHHYIDYGYNEGRLAI